MFSIFEPHTELIKRGKQRTPVEFGHKIVIAETEETFITDYEVLRNCPSDNHLTEIMLERHVADRMNQKLAPWYRFRAGVEGTISVLKRAFRLFRCLYRGFKHFAASVGLGIFSHNLVLLARLRM